MRGTAGLSWCPVAEPILIFKAELTSERKVKVTLGTDQEFFLALALRKVGVAVDNCLVEHEIKDELKSESIIVPNMPASLLNGLK